MSAVIIPFPVKPKPEPILEKSQVDSMKAAYEAVMERLGVLEFADSLELIPDTSPCEYTAPENDPA